jgi:hypothetical protein
MNGLVVNGDNVTALGLAVEHYEAEQVVWNGEGGETIFYQSEMPYDVPSQSAWMNGSLDGYASYNVAPSVTTHQAYGLGVYSYFDVAGVTIFSNSGIAAPVASGVTFSDLVSVYLAGSGGITYTIASDSPGITDNALLGRQQRRLHSGSKRSWEALRHGNFSQHNQCDLGRQHCGIVLHCELQPLSQHDLWLHSGLDKSDCFWPDERIVFRFGAGDRNHLLLPG